MKSLIRYILPFLLALVILNFIRLLTDLPLKDKFWGGIGGYIQHLEELLIITIVCYFYDWRIRKYLQKKVADFQSNILWEYLMLALILLFSINLLLVVGQSTGILYLGNGWLDYIITNIVCIPLYLLYYTLLRNSMVTENYHRQSLLLEKVKVEQLGMELKFLKSQYHPHFLFNALNTIYFQIEGRDDQARHSIELLSGLLRYQLYDIQKRVTLRQEVDYLKSYISFQQMRMSRRLKLTQVYDENIGDQLIQPLLFQPLVENAFKYVGGDYKIHFDITLKDNEVIFFVRNSICDADGRRNHEEVKTDASDTRCIKSTMDDSSHEEPNADIGDVHLETKGIGIENLCRRLNLLYPDKHKLTIDRHLNEFEAELRIQLEQ
jgi:Putative regulator of cell autolysis